MLRTALLVSLVLLVGASALSFDTEEAKSPVSKVVTLLKDMGEQLEKEGEEDEEAYDKMVCWCETNDKEKTQAIADAEQHLTDLGNLMEELTAQSSKLSQEISDLETQVADNTEALSKATGMREKELAEFNSAESETLAALGSVKKAINTLSKHNSLLQQQKQGISETSMMELQAELRRTVHQHRDKVSQMLMPSQKRTLLAFIQAPQDDYLIGMGAGIGGAIFAQESGPQNAGSYAPQSGAVFGILKNMKESFEANNAAAQREETGAVKAYQELKAAKESEIAAGTKQIEKKTDQMASADEKNAESKQDTEDTTETLGADQGFLKNLKEHCANMDAEMEARAKSRTEEIGSVSKALAVLTGDDAHDLFSKTFGFIQKESKVLSSRRQAAVRLLTAAAKAHPKLAFLATSTKLDNFGKVKETLSKMVDDLTKEKEDEIALKDWCIDELQKNERTTELTDRTKEGLAAKIEDLTSTIETLTKEIKGQKDAIAEMQVQLKKASEDREAENTVFRQTVADQEATAALLQKALDILKAQYDKKEEALIQRSKAVSRKASQPAGPPPPSGFKERKGAGAQSGGVMGMIEMIINDAKAMIAEATKDELAGQQAYEDFVKETNNAIEAAQNEIMNKSESKAKTEGEKTETNVELDGVMDELDQLRQANVDLHGECDYTTKNFDKRQEARDSEIEALKQSIAILSGAALGGFLQINVRP